MPWPPIEWPVSHWRRSSCTSVARACAAASAKSMRPQSSQSNPNGRRLVGHTTCASSFGAYAAAWLVASTLAPCTLKRMPGFGSFSVRSAVEGTSA